MSAFSFIIWHWEKQEKAFSDNLSLLRKKITLDAIHDLRVTLKKIRSYDKLCSAILDRKNPQKKHEIHDSLFSILGTYRDLQVNLHLLDNPEKGYQEIYGSIKKVLLVALREAKQKIVVAIKEYPVPESPSLTDEYTKEIVSITQAELIQKIKSLFREHLQKMVELLKDINTEAHLVRKELKDIFYWLSICPHHSVINPSKIKSLDHIQDDLGDWQDQRVLLRKIRYYRKEFVPGKTREYKKYKALEKRIREKNTRRLEVTRKKLEKWLNGISINNN